jgi:aminoglycoside phosphotransferase (APT) family kinase protein
VLEQRIARYLSSRIPDTTEVSVSNLYRIPGGQSRETWSFDAAWSQNGEQAQRGFILRRDPDASVLQTNREAEFRVMQAVHGRGVPIPEVLWLEQDASHLDRPFALMERLDGCEASPQKVLMDGAFIGGRTRMAAEFPEILARIHAIDWRAAGLDFLGAPTPESCGLTELEKWEAIVAGESLEPQPVLRAAFRWLRRHPPKPAQRVVLVHADYRTGNFLATPAGEIVGILDWEMTHLGDPLEDIGWSCIRPWRWMGTEHIGGLLDRADFYRLYGATSGITVDDESVRFWEVLGNVKLAAIFLTGGRSYCEGRTHSAMMAVLGRNVRRLELETMDLMRV